jgi:hypothetical protein
LQRGYAGIALTNRDYGRWVELDRSESLPRIGACQRAFYYARVMEIPTPRWTAYDAIRYSVQPLPGTKMKTAERAYTSPIWYTPR